MIITITAIIVTMMMMMIKQIISHLGQAVAAFF